MPTNQVGYVSYGGTQFALRQVQGEYQVRVRSGAYDPETLKPLYEYVPFGSNGGLGGSVLAASRNQFHYGTDILADTFDRITVGLKVNTTTLSLTNITCITEKYYDASGNAYVLIGNDSAVLPKIRLDTMASTGSKTFTGGTPILSHVLVLKSGLASGITDRGNATQQGNGLVIAGFAETSPIQQLDTVNVNLADTWSTVSATAYGGFFAVTQGTTNTETRLWKSTGQAGSGLASGPFSRIQSIALSTSNQDLSQHTLWNSTVYQVGDQGTAINSLLAWQRGLAVAKPEAVFGFDGSGNSYEIMGAHSYTSQMTGKNMAGWGTKLFVPTKFDLMATGGGNSAAVGLTALASNTSAIQGYPSAFCTWGDYAFCAFYDGTDTYITMLVPRTWQNVPNPYLIFPITKLSSKKCLAMRVVENNAGTQMLLFGNGADLSYIILSPLSSRTYQTGGIWQSARFGETGRPFLLDSIEIATKGLGANVNITPAIELDESGSYSAYTAWTSGTNQTLTLAPGTNDSATFMRLQLTYATNTNTLAPMVIGGGYYVRGHYVGARLKLIEREFRLGTYSSSHIGSDEVTTQNAIFALIGTETNVIDPNYYGNSSNHVEIVMDVQEKWGPGESAMGAERYTLVTSRPMAGSS